MTILSTGKPNEVGLAEPKMALELTRHLAALVSETSGIDFEALAGPDKSIRLRPTEASRGSGFSVRVQININTVEADLRPDGLAHNLVSTLRKHRADNTARIDDLLERKRALGWSVALEGFGDAQRDGPRIWVRSPLRANFHNHDQVAAEAVLLCLAVIILMTPDAALSRPVSLLVHEPELEGDIHEVTSRVRERSPRNRTSCLAIHGTSCLACGLNFGQLYGSTALGLIHVHHLNPLATYKEATSVDPATDLVPLCPNCHAVAHLSKPRPYTPTEIRAMMEKAKIT